MSLQLINRRSISLHCFHCRNAIFRRNVEYIKRRFFASETSHVDEVCIPERIERSPTAILEALASTVSRDFTAPHYRYLDDPYLIPKNSIEKRSYALAKESGRKSARYFLDNYPDLFFRDTSEPKIPSFNFKELFDENMDLTETDLIDRIHCNDIPNAIIAYENMKKKGVTIGANTLQNLLELVCFYNSTEPQGEEFREEVWFGGSENEANVRREWKDRDFAETLFHDITDKTPLNYLTILRGFAKYFHAEKALAIYEEMREKNFALNVEAYNSLIENVIFVCDSGSSRWEMTQRLLNDMTVDKLRPNVNTFNACLFVLFHSANWVNSSNLAFQLFAEMRRMKIRPSLASYYFLMKIVHKRGGDLRVLHEIVNQIQNKEFVIRHPKDVRFLDFAMTLCNARLSDLELGYKIHNLLNVGDNHKFLGSGLRENNYYRNFFALLALSETTSNLFEVYNKYVPNVWIAEAGTTTEILKNIELHDAYSYIPQLYSDISTFQHLLRGDTAETLFNVLAKQKQQDSLQKQFVEIAWSAFTAMKEQRQKMRSQMPFNIKEGMYENLLKVFSFGEDVQKAITILNEMEKKELSVQSPETLTDLCCLSIKQKRIDILVQCITFSTASGFTDVVTEIISRKEELNINDDLLKTIKLVAKIEDAESEVSLSDSKKPANESSQSLSSDSSSDSESSSDER